MNKEEDKNKIDHKKKVIIIGVACLVLFVAQAVFFNYFPAEETYPERDDVKTKQSTVTAYEQPEIEYPEIEPEVKERFNITDYEWVTYVDTEREAIKEIATLTYENGTPDYTFINITGYEWKSKNKTKKVKTNKVKIFHKDKQKWYNLNHTKYKVIEHKKNEVHYIMPNKKIYKKCFVNINNITCYRRGNTHSEELNELFNPELVNSDYPTYLYERKYI